MIRQTMIIGMFSASLALIGGCKANPKGPASAEAQALMDGDGKPVQVIATTLPATTPTTVAVATTKSIVTAPSTRPATTSTAIIQTLPVRRVVMADDADQATKLRGWNNVVATYANGNVIAGPVYRLNPPPPRSQNLDDVVAIELYSTFLAFPQMLATPIWMFQTRPDAKIEYHGDEIPPSYNVDQALPYYETEKVPGIVDLKR